MKTTPIRKCLLVLFLLYHVSAFSQTAYFIDGYHGGVWGHYPDWNTRFMVDMLKKHPDWRINIELEPDTWDSAVIKDPEAMKEFQALFADQSVTGRIEYVNPSYGQSYLYNIPGESIIRQFDYGMKQVKRHFPSAVFTTYSSEEPCFTSALPQILKSYGYKYASLKNPNTCWGGYTRGFGGELVNWIGPDGSSITTVPRYEVEELLPNSTWQTTAWNNSKEYVHAALNYGIKHPVGMCLQDAGWKNGPWLGDGSGKYQPSEYRTWRDYIQNYSIGEADTDWAVSQEDMQVSLVWGSQILQKLAQRIRKAENTIMTTEKLAAMALIYNKQPWPEDAFERAWKPLLLSQHHDCWIVPYNRLHHTNWAGYVDEWTTTTRKISDSIIHRSLNNSSVTHRSMKASAEDDPAGSPFVRVFNSTGLNRQELVTLPLPPTMQGQVRMVDRNKKEVHAQLIEDQSSGKKSLLFMADVPSFGFNTYRLENVNGQNVKGEHEKNTQKKRKTDAFQAIRLEQLPDGQYQLESDFYKLVLNPAKGGVITSLVAKKLNNREFVDSKSERSFNELRGNFFRDGGFYSSTQSPATIDIVENNSLRLKIAIKGAIADHPYTQIITLSKGQPRIDFTVKIDWNGNPGIGDEYAQDQKWDPKDYRKAFYDDRKKLLVHFPASLSSQKIYKNAPFDVTESQLENTFFTHWDSIKHNIILNWVDLSDGSGDFGLALLTDHTGSYAHGQNHPLALTLQYSGIGLWGRNYKIEEPLDVSYAIIPHQGKWDAAGIWTEGEKWNERLVATQLNTHQPPADFSRSFIHTEERGLQLSSVTASGSDLLIRVFNAEGDSSAKKIHLNLPVRNAVLVELDGRDSESLPLTKERNAGSSVTISMPRFGFRTIRVSLGDK